jgi:hypothetical protein
VAVNPRDIAHLEGLCPKDRMASSGTEPATFWLVAERLNHLRYRLPSSGKCWFPHGAERVSPTRTERDAVTQWCHDHLHRRPSHNKQRQFPNSVRRCTSDICERASGRAVTPEMYQLRCGLARRPLSRPLAGSPVLYRGWPQASSQQTIRSLP